MSPCNVSQVVNEFYIIFWVNFRLFLCYESVSNRILNQKKKSCVSQKPSWRSCQSDGQQPASQILANVDIVPSSFTQYKQHLFFRVPSRRIEFLPRQLGREGVREATGASPVDISRQVITASSQTPGAVCLCSSGERNTDTQHSSEPAHPNDRTRTAEVEGSRGRRSATGPLSRLRNPYLTRDGPTEAARHVGPRIRLLERLLPGFATPPRRAGSPPRAPC